MDPSRSSPLQQSFDPLTTAQSYVAAGLSVIPIARGTKEPDASLLPRVWDDAAGKSKPSWRMFQERRPTEDELLRWFARTSAGIGIVAGSISGGLVVLDLESLDSYARWRAAALELLPSTLLDALPLVATGKGRHVYFRMPDPIGNRKLALDGKQVLAETRGQGGYVLAPPSVHPNGQVYQLLAGDLAAIPLLDLGQALALLDAARALAPAVEHPASTAGDTGRDVIGAFNQAHTIEAILEAAGYLVERPGRYIRPGGERSSVVIRNGRSTHYNTADPLHSEAPGGAVYSHTPFSAWCVLKHAGDVKAAVKAAAVELGLAHTPSDVELLAQAGRAIGLGTTDQPDDDTWPYFIHAGTLWMHRSGRDGTPQTPLPLCNFTARITTETQLDDGEHQEELYTLVASCGRKTRLLSIKRHEFEGDGAVGRIVAALGAKARINPNAQPKYVLDAIKVFSRDVQEEVLYTHTGWVEQRYLLSNGYIDTSGWHAAPGCQLPARLQHYRLAPPTDGLPDALRLFDALLELAPPSVMIPLLGGVLLAPINHTTGAPAPMIHLYGPTGTHKTSITCCALALFGEFTPMQPTDTWTSTANSIQRLGWHLKDAPMLLDDYKRANVKEQQVTFLLQNYGDGMARGRLDANSEARSAYPIRAILLSSGEDQPEGEASTLARILSVQIERRGVHRGHLTTVQQHARQLQALTVDYLAWLSGAPPELARNEALHQSSRAIILSRLEGAVEHATNPGRVASNVAALYVAWETFGRFLLSRKHWPAERVEAWLLECKRHLFNLARGQIELTTQERYSQNFLETTRGLLASGKAILLNLEAGQQEMLTTQLLLGGYDRQGTYLIAQVAYDAVCTHLRAAGRTAGFSLRALSQLLEQDGLLQSTDPPSLVMRKRVNGARCWCWHLPPNLFDS